MRAPCRVCARTMAEREEIGYKEPFELARIEVLKLGAYLVSVLANEEFSS